MRYVYFIDHYDSFSLNLIDWLESESGSLKMIFLRHDDPEVAEIMKKSPKPIVLSPGPLSPAEARTSLDLVAHWQGKVPIFGFCLGHQIIGQVLGAQIARSAQPRHGVVEKVYLGDYPGLLKGMSDPFYAARYNSLTVKFQEVVSHLHISGLSEEGEIMAFSFERPGEAPSFGVQFHPESFLMKHDSHPILENWVKTVESWYQRSSV